MKAVDKTLPLGEYLQALYLDYINNFLTKEVFAEHYGISSTTAYFLIEAGKIEHEVIIRRLKGF